MVIDTSAILAILFDEPAAARIERAIEADLVRLMPAPSFLEAAIVAEARYGDPGGRELDLLVHKAQIQIVPFDAAQSEVARRAFRAYGRGHHPAKLNFGDCFAYALAKTSGEALLFTGSDFKKTDIRAVPLGS
jgi:ribonuclease VapC